MFLKNKNILYLILFSLLLCSTAFAQDYYADVVFDIDDSGVTEISGISNHDLLNETKTSIYTSKKSNMWTFEFKIDDIISNYVYEIKLPKYSEVNYIKVSGNLNVKQNNGRIIITGFGGDTDLNLLIQYKINKVKLKLFILEIVGFIIVIIVGGYFVYKFIKNKFKKPVNTVNLYALTDRQRKMYEILRRERKPMTQHDLEVEMGIPKSSISRNINSLLRKKIILKESKGKTNIIYLKK